MMLFDRVKQAAADLACAGREEIEKAKSAGVPAYFSDGQGIVREMPDSSRERVAIGADGHEVILGQLRPGMHQSPTASGSGT
jgi:hypothetical protein